MAANSQQLPPKEAGIFKKVVRCYECKQYKNGLKFARQILSNPKHSEHGETMAMKGLLLSYMGKKEEAFDFVRKGLKNNLRSHVCWHVYGLLQRTEKKYDEAIKCYRNALKWDTDNVQILRDLSLLQIQMRDVEGFRDTRYQLLKIRPAQRTSWIGYALAYHLLKDYEMALKVVGEYRKTMTPKAKLPDYEYSEMILYEVQLLTEAGMIDQAVKHMKSFESKISDILSLQETKASIALKADRIHDAEILYRQLVHRNPGNSFYLEQLEKCVGVTTVDDRVQFYNQLQQKYPRSHVIRRLPLTFTSGSCFKTLLDTFLRRALNKGVPSLFISVCAFYENPEKVRIIEELVCSYLSSLEFSGKLSDDGPEEPPNTLLWTRAFLAQHYDKVGSYVKALEFINQAIEHTPTEVHLYMTKAQILKHAGDESEASRFMEEARSLDTADRFINCKCVKYLLRINEIDQAVETAGLFTREGLPTLQTMDEMQCMWFQLEMARAFRRTGKLGEALMKLHEMDKHFSDMIDDQFDFHTYCMRKIALRSYVSVLRLEDNIRKHPFYFKAASLAIEIYLYLHDNPGAKDAVLNGPEVNTSELSASELKKIQRKKKKALLKAQEEKKENASQKASEDDKKGDQQKYPFFDATELLNTKTPLEDALKFLVPLQLMSSERIETHLLAFAIHYRRRKFLLMLQSIKRAIKIDPENEKLHLSIVQFVVEVEGCRGSLADPVRTVIDESLPLITHGNTLTELNRNYLQKHKDSHPHLVYGARALYAIGPNNKDKALGYLTELADSVSGKTIETCSQVLELLKNGSFGADLEEVLTSYTQQCSQLFPLATAFKPSPNPIEPAGPLDKKVVDKPDKVSRKVQPVSNIAMSELSKDINDGTANGAD